MKLKTIYLLLCVLGAALPYWQSIPWLMQNGLDLQLLYRQLLANRISAFFGLDVVISALALLVFVAAEDRRFGITRWWLPVLAVFTVGVSLALPLFLYMRELQLGTRQRGTTIPTA